MRGVAAYQGGLTKGVFMNLFAVSSLEADALPRTSHKRFGGGSYYLYGKDAVNAVLKTDGMEKWRARLRFRAGHPCIIRWQNQPHCVRLAALKEERLHEREAQRQGWFQVGRGPCAGA